MLRRALGVPAAADVDHLNTDDLAGLERFLRANDGGRAAA